MKKSLLLFVVLFCSVSLAFAQSNISAKKAAIAKPFQNITPEQKMAEVNAAQLKRKEAEKNATPIVVTPGNDTRISKAMNVVEKSAAPKHN